ncbi:hypothetical protein M8C21_003882 [Ambrosia artemisiifolia]|uniref:Uncharacterized protein n=1 Tax=Ambrosia artemisiifolia TaxID=4212 RepID=A0AAD5GDG9_AMBAR|nr:hypothetical protein M8C21_003882 [Ambrosia artemisiifolia]
MVYGTTYSRCCLNLIIFILTQYMKLGRCRLQPNGWECGYCVMMAIEHMRINKTRMVRQGEINKFVERTLKVFISSFGHGDAVEED